MRGAISAGQAAIDKERLDVLLGVRGEDNDRAVRLAEHIALQKQLTKATNKLTAANNVTIPALTATITALASPNTAQFNAAIADLIALHAALTEIKEAIA
jgi:hypothetical protein